MTYDRVRDHDETRLAVGYHLRRTRSFSSILNSAFSPPNWGLLLKTGVYVRVVFFNRILYLLFCLPVVKNYNRFFLTYFVRFSDLSEIAVQQLELFTTT